MNGLIGKKVGMTQVYDEQGKQIPVTVLEVGPCPVVQRKTLEKDGYDAAQLGFGEQKEHRLTSADRGHLKAASAAPQKVLCEIRLESGDECKLGDVISVGLFEGAGWVDVTATCKGRGFQGVVKRFRMGGGKMTHGSTTHRRVGSIGMREWPARVLKGKRLPGHMGDRTVTTQNLKVVQVRPDDNVILVQGAVPGPNGGIVIVRKAIKKAAK